MAELKAAGVPSSAALKNNYLFTASIQFKNFYVLSFFLNN
jgi:hypothetical protein